MASKCKFVIYEGSDTESSQTSRNDVGYLVSTPKNKILDRDNSKRVPLSDVKNTNNAPTFGTPRAIEVVSKRLHQNEIESVSISDNTPPLPTRQPLILRPKGRVKGTQKSKERTLFDLDSAFSNFAMTPKKVKPQRQKDEHKKGMLRKKRLPALVDRSVSMSPVDMELENSEDMNDSRIELFPDTPDPRINTTSLHTMDTVEFPEAADLSVDTSWNSTSRSQNLHVFTTGKKSMKRPVLALPSAKCTIIIKTNPHHLQYTADIDPLFTVPETRKKRGRIWVKNTM